MGVGGGDVFMRSSARLTLRDVVLVGGRKDEVLELGVEGAVKR